MLEKLQRTIQHLNAVGTLTVELNCLIAGKQLPKALGLGLMS
jgi:hypothetical protein